MCGLLLSKNKWLYHFVYLAIFMAKRNWTYCKMLSSNINHQQYIEDHVKFQQDDALFHNAVAVHVYLNRTFSGPCVRRRGCIKWLDRQIFHHTFFLLWGHIQVGSKTPLRKNCVWMCSNNMCGMFDLDTSKISVWLVSGGYFQYLEVIFTCQNFLENLKRMFKLSLTPCLLYISYLHNT